MSDQDYEVGYGRPPRETQFVKGRSGNPKGRPRGTRNTATIFNEVMNQLVQVTENGRTRAITRREAMLIQMANKAVAGDLKAAREVLALHRYFDLPANRDIETEDPAIEDDRALMQSLMRRMQSGSSNANSDPGETA